MRKRPTTTDVERAAAEGKLIPPRKQKGTWPIGVMLAIGWIALLSATNMSLLAAIQVGMIGLGAIGTAIVLCFYRN